MIHFFGQPNTKVFAVQTQGELSPEDLSKLQWLFGNQSKINNSTIETPFVGPRAAMITPWSTNAVEITQNMGVSGIKRIESFTACLESSSDFDPMLSAKFGQLNQEIFRVLKKEGFNIYTVRNHMDGDFKKGTHRGEDMYEMNGFIVHYFSENKIKNLLDGFTNVSIENFDEGSFPRKLSLVINKKK